MNFERKFNEIIIKKDLAIIKIKNSKLGDVDCLIDTKDVEKVKGFYWNLRIDTRKPNRTAYVETRYKGKRIHLHRLITDCPPDMIVDHINHNGLDNRCQNLRIVTQQQNCLNRKCRGVSFNPRDNYWVAYANSKIYGRYETEEQAIQRRKFLETLVKIGDWETLNNLKCEKLVRSSAIPA